MSKTELEVDFFKHHSTATKPSKVIATGKVFAIALTAWFACSFMHEQQTQSSERELVQSLVHDYSIDAHSMEQAMWLSKDPVHKQALKNGLVHVYEIESCLLAIEPDRHVYAAIDQCKRARLPDASRASSVGHRLIAGSSLATSLLHLPAE